jgi:hypothetical protein
MSRICDNIGNKNVPRLKQPLEEKKIREPENHKSFVDVVSATVRVGSFLRIMCRLMLRSPSFDLRLNGCGEQRSVDHCDQ